jgi:hypothetical protein
MSFLIGALNCGNTQNDCHRANTYFGITFEVLKLEPAAVEEIRIAFKALNVTRAAAICGRGNQDRHCTLALSPVGAAGGSDELEVE